MIHSIIQQRQCREVLGTKKGGTTLAVSAKQRAISRRGLRSVVYLDELVLNWSSQPNNWTKLLFWLTGSAPGLKINLVYLNLFCPDKQAVAQAVLNALDGDPAIVPAHGTPLVHIVDAARVRALVEPLAKSAAG